MSLKTILAAKGDNIVCIEPTADLTAAAKLLWHECDLRAAPNNVRSWESKGLNADVAFGPFMTHGGYW
jgi:hypothetical protein